MAAFDLAPVFVGPDVGPFAPDPRFALAPVLAPNPYLLLLESILPAPPTVGSVQPITFSVRGVDWAPQLGQLVAVVALFPGSGTSDLVWFEGTFSDHYPGGSNSATQTASGVDFQIQRTPLWPEVFTLDVLALDPAGVLRWANAGPWSPPGITPGPDVDALTPMPPATLAPTGSITVHVVDPTAGLQLVRFDVSYPGGKTEVVFDGAAFPAPFAASTQPGGNGTGNWVLRRSPLWPANPTVSWQIVDGEGRETTGSATWTLSPPVVSGPVLSATPGTITSTDPISFVVTDETAGLAGPDFAISVFYPDGTTELVASPATGVSPGFSIDNSGTQPPPGPLTVLVFRALPWAQNPGLAVWLADVDGNTASGTFGPWTVTDPAASGPVVKNVQPPPGTLPGFDQPIAFDLVDAEALIVSAALKVVLGDNPAWEMAHDGTAFAPIYAKGSARTPITGGWHYILRRAGGWPPGLLSLQPLPVDASGNTGGSMGGNS